MTTRTERKTDDILAAAYSLFEEHGFHATGVDAIANEARTTKRTLYRIFGSKENLALRVIQIHDQNFREHLQRSIDAATGTPRQKILAVFDYYQGWFDSDGFRGCIFIKAMIEFQTSFPRLRNAAQGSKEQLRSYLEKLCSHLNIEDPRALSSEIQILLEGSIITAQASPGCESASNAKRVAASLIDAAEAHR